MYRNCRLCDKTRSRCYYSLPTAFNWHIPGKQILQCQGVGQIRGIRGSQLPGQISTGIQTELLLNQRCQTIYPTAQVRIATGKIHPVGTRKVGQHDFRRGSTVSMVAASEWMSTSTPAMRTVAAILPQRTGDAGVTSANRTSFCARTSANICSCNL